MKDDKMRKDFEAWASDEGEWPKAVERSRDGAYKLMSTDANWRVWQAATRAAVPAWQPIETAPKDGTSVLLWERWSTDPFVGSFYGGSWSASKEHVDTSGGWDSGIVVDKIDSHLITHWMPIPPAPEEKP